MLTETLEQLGAADVTVHDALAFLGFAVDELLGVVEAQPHDIVGLRLITTVLLTDKPDCFVEIHGQSLPSSVSRRAFWASVPTVRRSQPVMP